MIFLNSITLQYSKRKCINIDGRRYCQDDINQSINKKIKRRRSFRSLQTKEILIDEEWGVRYLIFIFNLLLLLYFFY